MNKGSKKIKLIGPPHWYEDDEENIGELDVSKENPKKMKQWPEWPDAKAEVDDTD